MINADSGFHSKQTLDELKARGVEAYVADRDMRQRDEAFDRRDRHKTRHRQERQREASKAFPPEPVIVSLKDFVFEPLAGTCQCPAGPYTANA